jgi:hypothetical protein
MKQMYLLGVTVAMALFAAGHAPAEGPETARMQAMIRNIEFITRNSSLEYAGQPFPGVTILTDDQLQLRFLAAAVHGSPIEAGRARGRASALYDRYRNRIFLSDATAITGPALLHELVHFLQHVNGKDDMFLNHHVCLEAEAYELQAIWQTETGIDLASKPDYGFVTTLYGVCNDADFSWIDSE